MQAVILAAGRGTRMGALTEDCPKALLEVNKKPLIEYELDVLPDIVEEIIVVLGYQGERIRERYGNTYKNRRLLYVEQDVLDGTAGAVWRAKDVLHDRFAVLMSDDIYGASDIRKCIDMSDWVTLVQHRDAIRSKGKVELDSEGNVVSITEGNHGDVPGLLGTNFFVLDTRLFSSELIPKAPGSSEYGLPQTVIAAARRLGIPFRAVESTSWFEITEPSDLQRAEDFLSSR